MLEGGAEQTGQREGLGPGRVGAGVDVDEREGGRPWVVQHRRPGMDLEGGLVAQPAQRGRPVRDEVIVGGAVLALAEAGLAPDGEPAGSGRRDVLLPEARCARTVGEALQIEWASRPGAAASRARSARSRRSALASSRAPPPRRHGVGREPCRGWSAAGPGRRHARCPPPRAGRARPARPPGRARTGPRSTRLRVGRARRMKPSSSRLGPSTARPAPSRPRARPPPGPRRARARHPAARGRASSPL